MEPSSLIRNERLKLAANFLNALGIGLIGMALLRPLIETGGAPWLTLAGWSLFGLAFHVLSHYILGYLRWETIMTAYDIAVPLLALVIAGFVVLLVRFLVWLDDRSHPAE